MRLIDMTGVSPLIRQRVAVRDWANIARIEGRSIEAVRRRFDARYDPPAAPLVRPVTPRLTVVQRIKARMRAVGLSRDQLRIRTGVGQRVLAPMLDGAEPLSERVLEEIERVLAEAEQRAAAKALT